MDHLGAFAYVRDFNHVLWENRHFCCPDKMSAVVHVFGVRLAHQALGMETVFANALTSENLGAAAGGADFNPHNKSEAEIQRC